MSDNIRIVVYNNVEQLNTTELAWYDFFIEVQALPRINMSVFNGKILHDWYKSAINPVVGSDVSDFIQFFKKSFELYIQKEHCLVIEIDKPFQGSAFNLDGEDLLNKEINDNPVFAIILQLLLNYRTEADDFFATKAMPSTLEIINRLPMALAFYLFRLLIQVIAKQKDGLFKLAALLSYFERNQVRGALFDDLREFYAWILSLQFSSAKNSMTLPSKG